MRVIPLMMLSLAAYGQAPAGSEQQPRYQAGWPCTGKERAFDLSYSKIAEASGGHLFLFDKAEVAGMSVLAIGDAKHKDTIVRASGKLESYVDIPIPVDASVDSLFVVASLQCMQTILLYDPQRSSVNASPADGAGQAGPGQQVAFQGEDHWFRAGRIATVLHPAAGEWLLRLAGSGAFSVAVQAHTAQGMHNVEVSGAQQKTLSLRLSAEVARPQFRLIGPEGEAIQPVPVDPVPDSPGLFRGTFQPGAAQFRILVEDGRGFHRVDPRLFQTVPVQ